MTSVVPASLGSVIDIALDIQNGKRTAVEVLDQYLKQIESYEGNVNAFNLVLEEQAKIDAESIDKLLENGNELGPLAGVPVAIKDNLCTRGVATTASSRILEGWEPPYDATVITKLKEAGAIIIGKTNCDEFAMGSSTENSAFGPTHNPHDLDLVPGGSSGGSAAAVAAGFAPAAIGSDTGGSIRQPASLCGVVGVKPTYGGVSRYGLLAFASSLDQVGPFAPTVADAALLHEVIGGHDPRDSTSIKNQNTSYSELIGHELNGLKVGVIKELLGEIDGIHPDVVSKCKKAADFLASAGAHVEYVSLPSAIYSLSAYYLIAPAEASSNLSRYDGVRYGLRVTGENLKEMNINTRTEGFGDEVKRRIMLGTYALSAGYYDAYYGKALKVRRLLSENLNELYDTYHVLLSPTSPCTAFPLGEKTQDPMTMYVNDICTIPANLAGHPAISVPFGNGTDGLPIGVQIMAPPMKEQVMYQVASALESGAHV